MYKATEIHTGTMPVSREVVPLAPSKTFPVDCASTCRAERGVWEGVEAADVPVGPPGHLREGARPERVPEVGGRGGYDLICQ